jgi:deazaflavin-dependent oxidoreductase (nitroreductase family)
MAKTYRLGPARRAINFMVTAMLRLGVGSKSSYLLTTTGRKSGLKRTTPVILVETDGGRWLVSPYGTTGWVQNVRATPEVSVRRGRNTEVLDATELSPDAAGPILKRYARNVRVTAPFFEAEAGDAVERFVAEAERHPVFQLTSSSSH